MGLSKARVLTGLLLAIIIAVPMSGKSIYMSADTGFEPFTTDSVLTVSGCVTHDFNIGNSNFTFSALMQPVKPSAAYSMLLIDNRADTLVLHFDTRKNPDTDEIASGYTDFSVYSSSRKTVLHTAKLSSLNFLRPPGANAVYISRSGDVIELYTGKQAKPIWRHRVTPGYSISQTGFEAQEDSPLRVLRAALYIDKSDRPCPVSVENIEQYFDVSTDPLEGLWEMLDYSIDDNHLLLGGHYRIAIVSDGNDGYNAIYISGADKCPNQWKKGDVKGVLKSTSLQRLFRLTWYDANGLPLENDATLQFDAKDPILTVTLPSRNSAIRFRRL